MCVFLDQVVVPPVCEEPIQRGLNYCNDIDYGIADLLTKSE